MPSVGIYTYELFNFYEVDQIVRIGTAGALNENVKLRDVVVGIGASTDSSYGEQFGLPGTFAPIADFSLARLAVEAGERMGIKTVEGNILSSDIFYNDDADTLQKWRKWDFSCGNGGSSLIYECCPCWKKSIMPIDNF